MPEEEIVEVEKKESDPKSKTGPKTEAAKEFVAGNLTKHGFYSNKFFQCSRCPRNPKAEKLWDGKSKCEEKKFLDRFGIERCSMEFDEFNRLKSHFFKEYKHFNQFTRWFNY